MDDLKYWIWLLGLPGIGSAAAARLVERFGSPERLYFARESDYKAIEGLTPKEINALSNKGLSKASAALETAGKSGFGVLTLADERYPDRLKNIPSAPIALFYKGRLPQFDSEPAIAVVGSRKASADGLISAQRLGLELAMSGMTVLSGLAAGIDTMAMQGALKAGGTVVGVLGCGLDVIYPRENGKLYDSVAESGVILSEFLPGTPPLGTNFPRRNRILSGLSLGVLVVEAAEKSGALITADYAAEQGRDIYAVPGSINSQVSRGTNLLLRDGAQLAQCGWDIAANYTGAFPGRLRMPDRTFRPAMVASPTAVFNKSDVREAIKDYSPPEKAVLICLAEGEKNKDEIISASGLDAPLVLSSLTMLEIDGAVAQRPGGMFALTLKM